MIDQQLLAVVAHELRKPLSPIAIAASLLHEAAGDEQKILHLQSVIERQVEHLARVVADLTDTTRLRTGSLSIERRTISSTDFVQQAADACRASLAEAHGGRVRATSAGEGRGTRFVVRLPNEAAALPLAC